MGNIIIGVSVFLLALLISFIFKQSAVKGKVGELFVAFWLKFWLDENIYTIINDIMLPDGQGGSTQIDHIVLSPYGIFVIETKNWRGYIFGGKDDENWTQSFGITKNYPQNPYKQNYKHIKCLAETTGLPENCFIHSIIMVGSCTIKTREKLPDSLVENGTELLAFIKKHQTVKLDIAALARVKAAVESNRIANTSSNRRKHIEYVNGIKQQKSHNKAAVSAIEVDPDFPDPPEIPDPPNVENKQ